MQGHLDFFLNEPRALQISLQMRLDGENKAGSHLITQEEHLFITLHFLKYFCPLPDNTASSDACFTDLHCINLHCFTMFGE